MVVICCVIELNSMTTTAFGALASLAGRKSTIVIHHDHVGKENLHYLEA